ncbi:MAG: hypothetical protein M1282_02805 [Chloroflexi bacterium]|nr:hypothetical protein [Chloroflexota bacterium]
MITSNTFTTNLPFRVGSPDSRTGLGSVFAAAVVNREFRNTLLQNPQAALESGYMGQPFLLTAEEHSLLTSIAATSLTDLAQRIMVSQGVGD